MRNGFSPAWACLLAAVLCLAGCGHQASSSSPAPEGRQSLTLRGSTTMEPLCREWAAGFMQAHPQVKVTVEGGGSNVGIDSLVLGLCDIAMSSQKISLEQLLDAQSKGRRINENLAGFAMYAVVVNPQNPVDRLTLQQVSAIFTRRITNWKEVGGPDLPIQVLYRSVGPGEYDHFLETVVRISEVKDPGLFMDQVKVLPDPAAIRAEVAKDRGAVGYLFHSDLVPEVKSLAIAPLGGRPYLTPEVKNVLNGDYPVLRPLYLYSDAHSSNPNTALFLEFIRSAPAVEAAISHQFIPLHREGSGQVPGSNPKTPRFNP